MDRDPRTLDETGPGGDAAQALLKVQVIAGAMALTAVTVAGMTWFLANFGGWPAPAGDGSPVAGALAIAAAAALLAAPFVERRMLGPSAPSAPRPPSPGIERYQRAKTIGFALRELVALLGFVLAILTGEPLWCYGLSAAALVGMALAWPRAADLPPRAGGRTPGSVEPG